tara:strand:- start:644 stop:1099 length:456 start_codon:yes stop_codon:yes gene_type:complete
MNSLVDKRIIELLYKASNKGVKVDLIIRGACCLYPQRKGLSENIRVISVIGRFLEHSRIFWFQNNNNPEVFIGSADWMRRNLDRRVEALTPILSKKLIKELDFLLDLYLQDNSGAWEMQSDGSYKKAKCSNLKVSAQRKFMKNNSDLDNRF